MNAKDRRRLAELCGYSLEVYPATKQFPARHFLRGENLPQIKFESWHPDTDISQAMMVEETIPEEKQEIYCCQLEDIVAADTRRWDIFPLLHATADQRCRAALAALKEGEG